MCYLTIHGSYQSAIPVNSSCEVWTCDILLPWDMIRRWTEAVIYWLRSMVLSGTGCCWILIPRETRLRGVKQTGVRSRSYHQRSIDLCAILLHRVPGVDGIGQHGVRWTAMTPFNWNFRDLRPLPSSWNHCLKREFLWEREKQKKHFFPFLLTLFSSSCNNAIIIN